ncbi:MAG: YfhO family protein [Eubacteriales bacterium]|nr:YfhO family protein [Eubacteriales bacterium]
MSKKRQEQLSYLSIYTLCFLLLFLGAFSMLIIYRKSLVWTTDAKPQYLVYLQYTGKYLRDFLRRAMHGDVSLRMFDFHIGLGEDVRSVFRTHLSDFLSVFVPSKNTEILYNVLMVVRFYLAGLCFSVFCFERKMGRWHTLIGSLSYVFCGYILHFGAKHPVFTAPMILLPLLLISMDRVVRKKQGWLFLYSLLVGLSLMTNYYFLYMNTFAMGIYALLTYASPLPPRGRRVVEFFKMMGRIIFGYLLGCGMAMVFFLPTIIRLFNSVRVGGADEAISSLWHYNHNRLIGLYLNLAAPGRDAGSATFLNFVVLLLPALVLLFARKLREHWQLKAVVLIELVLLYMPAGGYMLSGFSAFNNRWSYIVSFTAALILVVMLDEFRKMSRLQLAAVTASVALYAVLTFLYRRDDARTIAAMFALMICTGVFFWFNCSKKLTQRIYRASITAIVCMSIVMNGVLSFFPGVSGFLSEFSRWNSAAADLASSGYQYAAAIQDQDFFRVDTHLTNDNFENTPIYLEYNGTSFYNSIVNGNIVNYHREMENIGISAIHRIYSMDGRTPMEALANVKYYMTLRDREGYLPYGFEIDEEHSGPDYVIYKNTYPLSFGYTYDHYLTQETYENLSALQRQEIMLSAVYTADTVPSSKNFTEVKEAENYLSDKPVFVSADDGIELNKKRIKVTEKDAGINYTYQRKAGYEIYLRLKGLYRNTPNARVNISTSDVSKHLTVRGTARRYSLGRKDYLVYLGYSTQDGEDSLKISFNGRGTYKLKDCEILYVPRDDYAEKISERNAESLQNVTVGQNQVTGTVSLSTDKIMVFSVPYSSGWSVYVDGEKVDAFRANSAYLGTELSAGDHEVTLKYTSPGMMAGARLSFLSIMIYLALLQVYRSRKNTEARVGRKKS